MLQYAQPTLSPSQYPQPQYGGGAQPVVNVNLPKPNNQYSTTTQQSYGYNTQVPPQATQSYGSSSYGNSPNNNGSRQNYYNPQGFNDDTNRYDDSINDNRRSESPKNQRNQQFRRNVQVENEGKSIPPPNSDAWDAAPVPQQEKQWNPNNVPW